VRPRDALDKHKLVILPHKYILTVEYADALIAYVKGGETRL